MSVPRLLAWKAGALLTAALACVLAPVSPAAAGSGASSTRLSNGMEIVVIPDRRLPIVTHMVFYRAGAADDPAGKSGLAHLLEHLMFKATRTLASGEFSRIITMIGGRDNAYTTHDTTHYFQRVAKEHLPRVMALEADRMVNLALDAKEVLIERDVVREERRSTIEANPLVLLAEQMAAALYLNHPYGRPAIGWPRELEALKHEDATAFYRTHYAPNNAIIVVAGDVTFDEVAALAGSTYGRVAAVSPAGVRMRPNKPDGIATRRVMMEDARAPSDSLFRFYLADSYATGSHGRAEALEALMYILGGDESSRLHRQLVGRDVANVASASYQSNMRDGGRVSFAAIPRDGVSLQACETALDAVILDVLNTGVTEAELARAKAVLHAQAVFDADNKAVLARKVGEAMANGITLRDFDAREERLSALTIMDLQAAAKSTFIPKHSVTGLLKPAKKGPGG